MSQYEKQPTEFAEPTDAEVRARTLRNIAIALSLLGFMLLVAASVVMRSPS